MKRLLFLILCFSALISASAESISSTCPVPDGIELHPYDKYGIGLGQAALPQAAPAQSTDYIPLLEDGKEWYYNMISHGGLIWEDALPEYIGPEIQIKMKLEGKELINGKEYYIVQRHYVEGNEQYSNQERFCELEKFPYCYLYEDIEHRQVYAKFDPYHYDYIFGSSSPLSWGYGPEYELIYDFNYDRDGLVPYEIECLDGTHNGYLYIDKNDKPEGNLYAVEGLGAIDRYQFFPLYYYGADISGWVFCDLTHMRCTMHYPHLYKVVNGQGTTIYVNEAFYPGCTSKINLEKEADVEINGNVITVACSSEPVKIYSSAGALVRQYPAADTRQTIDLTSLPKGVYIVTVGAKTCKVAVR